MRGMATGAGNLRRFRLFWVMVAVWAALALSPAPGGGAAERRLHGFGKFRVVRIDPDGLSPRVVRIEAGVTVIWFNATNRYVSVVFHEGERLRRAARSPTLFFLAPDGTYLSAAYGPGATSSVSFSRPGVYKYFITGITLTEGAALGQVAVR